MFNALKIKIRRLLIWSQKYTQTDMIYLAKGGSWLTLGQIISTAAFFLLAVAFANLLDPVTYGNYRYILSLVGVLGIFTLTGMRTAIIQAVARGLEGSFYTGFKTKLKWGLLGSLVAIGGAIYYWIKGNSLLPIPLFISAIFLPLMLASQVYGGFLVGKKLFDIQVKYNTLSQIVSAGTLIGALFLTKNLFWLITIYFVSRTFLNYFFYFLTKSKFKPNKKEDPQTLSYGKHMSLLGVLITGALYLDRILVFHYLGAVPLAIYHFAITPVEQLWSFLKNFQPLALFKLTIRSKEEINKNLYKRTFQLLFIGGIIVLAYVLIAPFLYRILFPKYLESIFFSQLFSLTILFKLAGLFVGTIFPSHKLIKSQYIGVISSHLFLIISLLVLGALWGIIGIMTAKILFSFFALIIDIILWQREIKKARIKKIKPI
ncbi:MAG: oligosaccharide flippase family protein [Patescibacteria group bacterium]|nr:oligosaccharide flippase family protein [Patescibacteria group bacterium]